MATLKTENGEIITKDFLRINKPGLVTQGCILDFKEDNSRNKDKTPEWYKILQSRRFEVLRIEVVCGWSNGGFSPGFYSDFVYIVKELELSKDK
jgi:hypothetical protein|tara:strand:- start:286 stop:567 length:282 start_codon:yes stop_codon:yes gene_type:complete